MAMNFYRLSLDTYKAFIAFSEVQPNKLAAAFIEYEGDLKKETLLMAEENGLVKEGKLTIDGLRIARIICTPERTILASNSSFGKLPLCVFNFKEDFWVFVSIDNNNNVNLLAPIEKKEIISVVKDALIGNVNIINFLPLNITLNNDELMVYNLILMLMGDRKKLKQGSLLPLDCRFKFEDLIFNREFAKQALVGEVVSKNSEIFALMNDPERCKDIINKLIEKQILAKSSIDGYLQPGVTMFYRLAPQNGMFILSYSDLESKIGHKYYVFPNSLLEITADRNTLTFSATRDLDYSLWN